MPGFYHDFTSPRTTMPDETALLTQLRTALDASVGLALQPDTRTAHVKKSTDWTPAQITTAQNAIDTAPAITPQRQAQNEIDAWPIPYRALVLTLLDEINILRTHPAIGLTARTPAQALAGVRAKAGTL